MYIRFVNVCIVSHWCTAGFAEMAANTFGRVVNTCRVAHPTVGGSGNAKEGRERRRTIAAAAFALAMAMALPRQIQSGFYRKGSGLRWS